MGTLEHKLNLVVPKLIHVPAFETFKLTSKDDAMINALRQIELEDVTSTKTLSALYVTFQQISTVLHTQRIQKPSDHKSQWQTNHVSTSIPAPKLSELSQELVKKLILSLRMTLGNFQIMCWMCMLNKFIITNPV